MDSGNSSEEDYEPWPGCLMTSTGCHFGDYYTYKFMPHDKLCEFLNIPKDTPISLGDLEKLVIQYGKSHAGMNETPYRFDSFKYDKDLWALFELKETKVLKPRHLDNLLHKLVSQYDERKNPNYITTHSYIFQSIPTQSAAVDNVLSKSYTTEILYAPHSIPGHVQILKNVLTKAECATLITESEKVGFHTASYQTDNGYSDIRKSQRCLIDSRQFVQRLFDRLHSYLPQRFGEGTLKCIYDRLRILKYAIGDEFRAHKDGKTIDVDASVSKFSLLIYLNDDYGGGCTEFMNGDKEWVSVVPETGMVLIYDQNLLHRVPPLVGGCKYVIRTELMYIERPKEEYKLFVVNS